jgi:hypothetical protein
MIGAYLLGKCIPLLVLLLVPEDVIPLGEQEQEERQDVDV